MLAIDGLGENTRARSLAHTSGTAEKIGLRQLAALNGILQGHGQRRLSHYTVEGGRPILACRNNIRSTHTAKLRKNPRPCNFIRLHIVKQLKAGLHPNKMNRDDRSPESACLDVKNKTNTPIWKKANSTPAQAMPARHHL